MTTATEQKREQLQQFIRQVIMPEESVQAVIGIGSLAHGRARPDSDIDAVLFLDPFDWYVVPAEFIWLPADNSFHSVFSDDPDIRQEGLHFDLRRLDWRRWADPDFDWPEPDRVEMAHGWLAFDRSGKAADLIAERAAYDETIRLARLDEAIVRLDGYLDAGKLERTWRHLGPLIAHDRLQAAYHYLADALLAYNWSWRPWRYRQMEILLEQPWLPADFAERALPAAHPPALDEAGYLARAEILRDFLQELLAQLTADGDYSTAPVDQALIRARDEPGYGWNMGDWNAERVGRLLAQNGENNHG